MTPDRKPSSPEHSEIIFNYLSVDFGSNLPNMKPELMPKLLKLWSSALARSVDDKLVRTDAAKYPFAEDNGVMLAFDSSNNELAGIFIHRITENEDKKGLYIYICLVHEDYQGKGLMSQMVEKVIEQETPDFFYLRTQNEVMAQCVRKFAKDEVLYPFDGGIPQDVTAIANELMKEATTYEPDTMIFRRMYAKGNPLYGDRLERPGTNPAINDFFQKNINFQEGDAVLVIGLLNQSSS